MVTFKNGKKLNTVNLLGGSLQFQSAKRSTLEIIYDANIVTYDELKALYTDKDALSEITVSTMKSVQKTDNDGNPIYINPNTGEETIITKDEDVENYEPVMIDIEVVQSVHLNYTLPVELKLTVFNDIEVWCMKIAQMSDVEIMQIEQGAVLDALLQGV